MTPADRIEQAYIDAALRRLIASRSCTCSDCVTSLARHLALALRAGKEIVE